MLIQRRLKCSDQWLVKHVGENPYLQYFIGMKGNDPPNSGTLILDAACRPADIACPQDIDLLNQARERAEKTVDELCAAAGRKKPRMYRGRARKDDLSLSKARKRSGKAIRSAVRKRLQYIRRDFESGSHSIPRQSGPALGPAHRSGKSPRQHRVWRKTARQSGGWLRQD